MNWTLSDYESATPSNSSTSRSCSRSRTYESWNSDDYPSLDEYETEEWDENDNHEEIQENDTLEEKEKRFVTYPWDDNDHETEEQKSHGQTNHEYEYKYEHEYENQNDKDKDNNNPVRKEDWKKRNKYPCSDSSHSSSTSASTSSQHKNTNKVEFLLCRPRPRMTPTTMYTHQCRYYYCLNRLQRFATWIYLQYIHTGQDKYRQLLHDRVYQRLQPQGNQAHFRTLQPLFQSMGSHFQPIVLSKLHFVDYLYFLYTLPHFDQLQSQMIHDKKKQKKKKRIHHPHPNNFHNHKTQVRTTKKKRQKKSIAMILAEQNRWKRIQKKSLTKLPQQSEQEWLEQHVQKLSQLVQQQQQQQQEEIHEKEEEKDSLQSQTRQYNGRKLSNMMDYYRLHKNAILYYFTVCKVPIPNDFIEGLQQLFPYMEYRKRKLILQHPWNKEENEDEKGETTVASTTRWNGMDPDQQQQQQQQEQQWIAELKERMRETSKEKIHSYAIYEDRYFWDHDPGAHYDYYRVWVQQQKLLQGVQEGEQQQQEQQHQEQGKGKAGKQEERIKDTNTRSPTVSFPFLHLQSTKQEDPLKNQNDHEYVEDDYDESEDDEDIHEDSYYDDDDEEDNAEDHSYYEEEEDNHKEDPANENAGKDDDLTKNDHESMDKQKCEMDMIENKKNEISIPIRKVTRRKKRSNAPWRSYLRKLLRDQGLEYERLKRHWTLKPQERRDFATNLEYIVALGHQHRYCNRRFEAWLERMSSNNPMIPGLLSRSKEDDTREPYHDHSDQNEKNHEKSMVSSSSSLSSVASIYSSSWSQSSVASPSVSLIKRNGTDLTRKRKFEEEQPNCNASNASSSALNQEHQSRKQSKLQLDDRNTLRKKVKRLFHSEDNFIYRKLIYHQSQFIPWPPKLSLQYDDIDMLYDEEYGDNIDMNDFDKYWKERENLNNYQAARYDSAIDRSTSGFKKTDHSCDALRDMIRQSWERAVHIANSTVPIRHTVPFRHKFFTKADPDIQNSHLPDFSLDRIDDDIMFEPKKRIDTFGVSWYICDCCQASHFLTLESWKAHFYGEKGNDDGCRHNFIQSRREQIVRSILEKEAMFTVDGALQILLTYVKEQIKSQSGTTHAVHLMDWRDVLKAFETFVDNTSEQDASSVMNTVMIHPDSVPICLNKHVLQAWKMRLVERYAVMPRF